MNPYDNVLKPAESGETPAKKRIRSAMLQMLEESGPDQIEVKVLCRLARTARSTFYLYYSNTEDVMKDMANVLVKDLTELVHCHNLINRDFVARIWDCLSSDKETIRIAALRHRNTAYIERLKLGIQYLLWERLFYSCSEPHPEAQLVTEMASSSLLQAFFYDLEPAGAAAAGSLPPDEEEGAAVSGRETITGMLDMLDSRLYRTTIRCRVLKTGVPV